ncbi:MAG: glycoside hydrolase family 15 protein [Bacteroidales bacterium]|nr:glycoside hydrolase family 15 protein [Bacteroidales bacterium]
MKNTTNNKEKIKKLVEITEQLIKDCALENGGIVAANSANDYFPANAKNYFYVWPRDAAFTCLVADMMGLKEIQKKFFKWCLFRAEGFRESGLFYEKYYPNGLKALMNFQPDQTGAVLFAACNYCKKHPEEANYAEIVELITLAAEGICQSWDGNCFNTVTNDLWEERLCFPHLKENFSYSLASCIGGLRAANSVIETKLWLDVAKMMSEQLEKHCVEGCFIRSYGKLPDKRVDASLLGLVYPFEVYDANHKGIIDTVTEIEKRLVKEGGVQRYEHDEYDGWMYEGKHLKKGAGAWPLLNFWLSIYFSVKGDTEKANTYYYWVLDKMGDNLYIPEQIFNNNIQVSVSPLLWSHVMFYLATHKLDLI